MSPEFLFAVSNGFDIAQWAVTSAATAGILAPFVMAITKASEIFGLSGKAQLAFAGVIGLVMGSFAQVAFFGVPDSILDWFLLVLYAVLIAGTAVGTYETIKHAVKKANG